MKFERWMVDAAAAGALALWAFASYRQSVRAGADEGMARRAALADAAILGIGYVAARPIIFRELEARAFLPGPEIPAAPTINVTPKRGPGRPTKAAAAPVVTVAGA